MSIAQKIMTAIVWGDTGKWVDPKFAPPKDPQKEGQIEAMRKTQERDMQLIRNKLAQLKK